MAALERPEAQEALDPQAHTLPAMTIMAAVEQEAEEVPEEPTAELEGMLRKPRPIRMTPGLRGVKAEPAETAGPSAESAVQEAWADITATTATIPTAETVGTARLPAERQDEERQAPHTIAPITEQLGHHLSTIMREEAAEAAPEARETAP